MKHRRLSATAIISENDGWVLVYTFILLLLILSMSISAFAVARFRVVSGKGFEHVLAGADAKEGECTVESVKLPVPEKWDHMVFRTDVTDKSTESGGKDLYWRSVATVNSCSMDKDIRLSCNRPYILFLLQDSDTMRRSSGYDYDDNTVYFKNSKGEISVCRYVLGDMDHEVRPEGTYFRGSYGNLHMKAPVSEITGCSGAMPVSTYYMQLMTELAGSVSIAETALATVSEGMVVSYEEPKRDIIRTMNATAFDEDDARLARSLLGLLDKENSKCATARHIVLMSDGIAGDDGSIPAWLRDYDKDFNANDTYIPGTGSHCLDDVSLYSALQGVSVHVMGPESDFLKTVALKGKGKYIPDSDDLIKDTPFTSTMPVKIGNKIVLMENRFGRLGTSFIDVGDTKYFTTGAAGSLIQSTPFRHPGPAESVYSEGDSLYVSTVGDSVSLIDIASGKMEWSVRGPGGMIKAADGCIIAGPSSEGRLFCLKNTPECLWETDADMFDISASTAFIVKDNVIRALDVSSGREVFRNGFEEKITSINYDPAEALVYAGTSNGMIFVMSKELVLNALIPTGVKDDILDIHAYTFRKALFLCGHTKDYVFSTDMRRLLWSQKVRSPEIIKMLIMDGRVYVVRFFESGPCGGIDTGSSYMDIYDARTGKQISEEHVCSGRLFGPYIDSENGRLVFSSYDMKIHEFDYSGLYGAESCYLGTRLPGREM